jgi:zinc transporter ZupT
MCQLQADGGTGGTGGGASSSRTPPAVVEIMEADHHSFMLKKMGGCWLACLHVLQSPCLPRARLKDRVDPALNPHSPPPAGLLTALALFIHNFPEGLVRRPADPCPRSNRA